MRFIRISILTAYATLFSHGCNEPTSLPINKTQVEKRGSNKNTEEIVLTDEQFYILPPFKGRVVKCEDQGYPKDLFRMPGPLLRITIAANDGRLIVIEKFRSALHASAELHKITEKPELNFPHDIRMLRASLKNTEEIVLSDEEFNIVPPFKGRVVKCENQGNLEKVLHDCGPLLRITIAANDGRLFVIEKFQSGLHAAAEISELTEKPELNFPHDIRMLRAFIQW
ncbi:MAG: hypothetical protein SGI77_01270 [Pirellulaceae bacterium]|nr:hypothetical protein [Pirellulaceae bacterium]